MTAANALRAALLADLEATPLNPLEATDVLLDVLAVHVASFDIPPEVVEAEFEARHEVAVGAVAQAMLTHGLVQ